jgi:hypothetical protein
VVRKEPGTRDSRYGASRPTVDELLRTRAQANRANANFLKAELNTAMTFSAAALHSEEPVRKRRNLRAARKAYDTILRLIDKVTLSKADAQLFERNLVRLRSELQRLGEIF